MRGLAFSDVGSRSKEQVVFAGYGITVPESQDFGYDSYFGLDVEDKIVLVLRYFARRCVRGREERPQRATPGFATRR